MLDLGVSYGQTVTSTDVQQQNTTEVQTGEAVPPNHTPPDNTLAAHMSVEVPGWSTFQYPSQGLQEGRVHNTAVCPVSRNNNERPIHDQKAQGDHPLVHRGKLQHMVAELGRYEQAHTSSPSLTCSQIWLARSSILILQTGFIHYFTKMMSVLLIFSHFWLSCCHCHSI